VISLSSTAHRSWRSTGNTTVSGQANANSFQYTGRENDGTGPYYYRARYYQPTLQRFISEDPLGFRGGDWNLYAYVRNNPVQYRDPLGLCVTDNPADCFPPPVVPVDSPRPIGGRKDAPLLCGLMQDRPILVGLTAGGPVIGPGELGRCLDACAAGGEAWRRYCNSLPPYPPGLKRGCWAVALMGEVACRGYCFRYWGK